MGGIQMIVVGGFYLLPPAPNKWAQGEGKYVFQSELWECIIPHKIVLPSVHRQSDEMFITAINELSRGCPTAMTVKYITQGSTENNREITTHSWRVDVHMTYLDKLLAEPGECRLYHAVKSNSVKSKIRSSIDAPDVLPLKIGAPVILTICLTVLWMDWEVLWRPSMMIPSQYITLSERCAWYLSTWLLPIWSSHHETYIRREANAVDFSIWPYFTQESGYD